MIEDKELGLKVAVNDEEAKWINIEKKAKEGIENNQTEIEINKAIMKLAEEKLKEMKKGRGKYIG